jgi:hypothetical protein
VAIRDACRPCQNGPTVPRRLMPLNGVHHFCSSKKQNGIIFHRVWDDAVNLLACLWLESTRRWNLKISAKVLHCLSCPSENTFFARRSHRRSPLGDYSALPAGTTPPQAEPPGLRRREPPSAACEWSGQSKPVEPPESLNDRRSGTSKAQTESEGPLESLPQKRASETTEEVEGKGRAGLVSVT